MHIITFYLFKKNKG